METWPRQVHAQQAVRQARTPGGAVLLQPPLRKHLVPLRARAVGAQHDAHNPASGPCSFHLQSPASTFSDLRLSTVMHRKGQRRVQHL
jgi:hypothetical protein